MCKQYLISVVKEDKKGMSVQVIKFGLLLLSWVYWVIVKLRAACYWSRLLPSHKLSKPVICIGNITTGGTGKTPLVIYLAKMVKAIGKKPAILTRGYMANGCRMAKSDEVRVLEKALPDVPILVGKDRIKRAQEYLNEHVVDIFIMDDGFQHYRLQRDQDIVAVNAAEPWGNGYLLPRGFLREPRSALKRADIIILTKAGRDAHNNEQVRQQLKGILKANTPVILSKHVPVALYALEDDRPVELAVLEGKKMALLCSIGDPKSFGESVEELGAELKKRFCYLDHYNYQKSDIITIIDQCKEVQISSLITTEKDAVKLLRFKEMFCGKLEVLVLTIDLELIDGKDQLVERIHSVLHA